MNRQQLVDAVGERLGDRRTAAAAVEAVLDTVSETLAEGEKVSIFGFGVFEKVDRAARTARNPTTGAAVEVPATSVPRFRPGQALKDAVTGRARTTSSAPARTRTAGRPAAGSAPTGTPATASAKAGRARRKAGPEGTAPEGTATKGKATKGKGKKADGKKSGGKKSDGGKKSKST